MISLGEMKFRLLLIAASLFAGALHAARIPTFAAAKLVLGQADFTTASVPSQPTATSLDKPSAVVVDALTGKVFVADTGNNRVLRYASAASLGNGAAAEAVFGQDNFTSNAAPAAAADSLDSPGALWIDTAGRLWVSDTDNNRIVMYANAATAGNGPDATLVLGQPNATTGTLLNPPSAASLNSPEGLCVDAGGRLWVADTGNNRVLRFDNAATNVTGGASSQADGVFGQGQNNPYTTSTDGSDNLHFMSPTGVAVDASGILWVADRGNNRIMGFPSAATISNGANGARVLGQPDYNGGSTTAGLSSSAISGPTGMFVDTAGNLWLLDQGNNRALRFASIETIDNGRPASTVVGQSNFATSFANLTARGLDTAAPGYAPGLFVQPDGSLWISDLNHNRVLRYSIEDSGPPTVGISGKSKVVTTKSRIVLHGSASDDTGVTSVTLRVGNKTLAAAGTTAWKRTIPLKKKRTVVKAYAHDAAGNVSPPAKVIILKKARPLH